MAYLDLGSDYDTINNPEFKELTESVARISEVSLRLRRKVKSIQVILNEQILPNPGVVVLKPGVLGIGWLNYA